MEGINMFIENNLYFISSYEECDSSDPAEFGLTSS